MTLEEYKKEVDKNIENLFNKANEFEKILLCNMVDIINNLCEEKQELIYHLKEQIKQCDKDIKRFKGNYNVYFAQLNDLDVIKKVYEEILSKIEKE